MHLKHLTINGFKSFADKTEIDFVPGLTGIVGPNGSGKSNITEAIRWALGEQSAKSLRGEKMGDVIFSGTASRPALNRAEVIMTFDNSDGYLKKQPTETTVCRRLYRNGESEFLINNQQVRLKDIVDLFMDSGLGKESFSFISQGRVEAIFNSKPEERRGILEEAAGVLKYKQQRQKAEKELQETDDNLDRVQDIIHELHQQLTPLEEQASLAKDYQRQHADYEKIHQEQLALEIHQLATEQDGLKAKAKLTAETITALTAKIKNLEGQSETLTVKDDALDKQITQTNDTLLAKSMKLESLTGQANVSTERESNLQQTLADLKTQQGDAKAQVAQAQKKTAELTAAQKTQKAKQQQLEQAQKVLIQGHTPAQLNEDLDAAQNHYIDLLNQQADIKNALTDAKKDQQVQDSQTQAQSRRSQELQNRLQAAQKQLADLESELDTCQQQAGAAAKQQVASRDAASQAKQAYDDLAGRYQQAYGLFQRAKSRYETLQELKEDYAGFFAGVRAVLKQKAHLPGVIGAVAELLTVPSQYQQALDIALGGNLQAVVTTDETAAKQAISYLKAQRAGRATFLPVSVIQPRMLPQTVEQRLAGQPGFVGVALNLIQCDQQVQRVMANLMGSLIVADNLDHGVALARLCQHRYRIVTLDGDLLNPGGAMTGGQVKKNTGSPLARTQEVQTLKGQLTAMVKTLKDQQTNMKSLADASSKAQDDLAAISAKASGTKAQAEAVASQRQSQQESVNALLRQAKAQKLAVQGQEDFASKLNNLMVKSAQVAKDIEAAQQKIDQLKATLAQASDAQASYQAKLTENKTALAVLKTQQQTTKDQLAQWQETFETQTARQQQLTTRIASIQKGSAESADEKQSREKTITALKAETKRLHQSQNSLTKAKAASREALSKLSAQITTTYTQQHQAMTESEQQNVSLSRIKTHLDTYLATLSETYQVTYEAAIKAATHTEADLPTLRAKLKLLKRGLDDLGAVNPNAISEYDQVKQRYDFLTKQQNDLLAAKKQLQDTMGELDEEVKKRFKEMFDATNEAFQEIFPRMFNGGAAHLSLTDPNDLLNTGLEISAQPPGKKLQRLSLLSGGERALTAIVLLFAILQVRPVPFSVLDEVEASLDDVNVNRFGEFLKHYSSDTQFIVITHRRGTMLAADMLYGVTMQESGVSKMVAVALDSVRQDEEKPAR